VNDKTDVTRGLLDFLWNTNWEQCWSIRGKSLDSPLIWQTSLIEVTAAILCSRRDCANSFFFWTWIFHSVRFYFERWCINFYYVAALFGEIPIWISVRTFAHISWQSYFFIVVSWYSWCNDGEVRHSVSC